MVGCAAANFLEHKPVPFILLDQVRNKHCQEHVPILGDATNSRLLQEAGIDQAKGVIVTTNDDSTNIFLTLSSRQSNPYIRIVARTNSDENVEQLYAAGADFVISNASVGANILTNVLKSKESIFLTEGLTIFRRPLPEGLVGKTIEESQIRPQTGCSIVALERPGQDPLPSPAPNVKLEAGTKLVLIGGSREEKKFIHLFAGKAAPKQPQGKVGVSS
jgi:Trk K+ transport system NAD-binding subunit